MATQLKLHEGTATRFHAKKVSGQLDPKSLYLVDGKLQFAVTSSTVFAFADIDTVTELIAGISDGSGVTLGSQAGLAPTTSGTSGTSSYAARADHTHPDTIYFVYEN